MDAAQLLGFLSALLALFIFISFFKKNLKKSPPLHPSEPAGAWPIIGHLGILSGTAPLHRTFADLSDRYGPIITLRLGQKRVLVVSSMELAKECFTTNDRALANRPPLLSAKILGYDRVVVGLAPYGPLWRDLRKIATIELLSSQRIESFKHVWLEEMESIIHGLYKGCREGGMVDMKRLLSLMTLNIIVRIVSGKRYVEFDSHGKDDKRGREFVEVIEAFFYLLGLFTVSDAFPCLERLDIDGHGKTMRSVHKRMDEIAASWVSEHRRKRVDSDNISSDDGDFIDILINRLGDGEEADTIIRSLALTMIVAGSDTTSGTLVWAISLLLNNRHVLEKAQKELDVQVGRERHVDESDTKSLIYLEAIVKEVMRLYPPAPLLIPHESIEPINIGDYHVPAGTTVNINVWKIQRDPKLWPDAEQFRPERFLAAEHNNMAAATFGGKSYEFLPFGSGRRSCPGSLLCITIVRLTLARLIQGFDWFAPNNGPTDMTEGFGQTLHKATPLDVFL